MKRARIILVLAIFVGGCSEDPIPPIAQPAPGPQIGNSQTLVSYKDEKGQLIVKNISNQIVYQTQLEALETVRNHQTTGTGVAYQTSDATMHVVDLLQGGRVIMTEPGVSTFKISEEVFSFTVHDRFYAKNKRGDWIVKACEVLDYQISKTLVAFRTLIDECPGNGTDKTNVLNVYNSEGTQLIHEGDVIDYQISDELIAFVDRDSMLSVYHANGSPVVVHDPDETIEMIRFYEVVGFEISNDLLAIAIEDDQIKPYKYVMIIDAKRGSRIKDAVAQDFDISDNFIALVSPISNPYSRDVLSFGQHTRYGFIPPLNWQWIYTRMGFERQRDQTYLNVTDRNNNKMVLTSTFHNCQFAGGRENTGNEMVVYTDLAGNLHFMRDGREIQVNRPPIQGQQDINNQDQSLPNGQPGFDPHAHQNYGSNGTGFYGTRYHVTKDAVIFADSGDGHGRALMVTSTGQAVDLGVPYNALSIHSPSTQCVSTFGEKAVCRNVETVKTRVMKPVKDDQADDDPNAT